MLKQKRTKKISILISLIVLICTIFTISVFAEEPSGVKGTTCYTHGDVNADGIVSSKDAVYLLYNSVYGDSEYPLEQDGDFDKKDGVNSEDAVHLLYSVSGLFGDLFENFRLDGVIHAYDEPLWSWEVVDEEVVGVTAAFKCACGENVEVVSAEITDLTEVPATCAATGSKTYKVSAEYDGVEYEAEKVITLASVEHHYLETEFPCESVACLGCGLVQEGSHSYYETNRTEATCTEPGRAYYKCDCGASYDEVVKEALGHTAGEERQEGCRFIPVCSECGADILEQAYDNHKYVATITQEPTCEAVGEKSYTCECGHSYTEPIAAKADAHVWNKGVTEGGVTTYSCTLCEATKTSIVSTESTAEVTAEALEDVSEVEVNEIAIQLDEKVVNQIKDTEVTDEAQMGVVISAEDVTEEVDFSEDVWETIGDNTVYDFTMTVNGTQVSEFNGLVTVSIPYTLQEGDDVDCIDIYYINDKGELELVAGQYSNGVVTFATSHFSYYTVTRLTPAQRCEAYGHSFSDKTVDATCLKEGYKLSVCVRCTETEKNITSEALGHDYQEEVTAATCTEDGQIVATCSHCGDVKTTKLFATGHTWEETESKETSCKEAGYIRSACANCSEEKEEVIPQLSHELSYTEVAATCETRGYTLAVCDVCGDSEKVSEVSALGHDYEGKWSWDEENLIATLTLVCTRDNCNSEVQKNAVVDIERQLLPTCANAGSTVYVAKVSYNQVIYSDQLVVSEEQIDHIPSEEMTFNALQHYYVCTACGSKLDAEEHILDEGTVTVEPTCTEEGEKISNCDCGFEKKETLPPLGHTMENDVCTTCGFSTNECDHTPTQYVDIVFDENADDTCCASVSYMTCECGQITEELFGGLYCDDAVYSSTYEEVDGALVETYITTCDTCGITETYTYNYEKIGAEDECLGIFHRAIKMVKEDGTVLFDRQTTSAEDTEHPWMIMGEQIDFAEAYGMCGGKAVQVSCPCGEVGGYYYDTSECDMNYWENSCTCNTCGIELESIMYDDEPITECTGITRGETIILRDGVELGRLEDVGFYENHNYAYEFVLDGETCSDGFTVTALCQNDGCGDTYTEHRTAGEGEHWSFGRTKDFSEFDICATEAWVSECPCGGESWTDLQDSCNWYWSGDNYSYEELEDGTIIERDSAICTECGLEQSSVYTRVPTEDPCEFKMTDDVVFTKDGTVVYEIHNQRYNINHDLELLEEVLEGETCEDGVIRYFVCAACGMEEEHHFEGHETITKAVYDLTDYGLCGETVYVNECACGENKDIINDRGQCEWDHWYYDYSTDTTVFKCRNCGAYKYSQEYMEDLGNCQSNRVVKYEYVKGYNVVLSVGIESITEYHDWAYSFDLKGDVCSDGYDVVETCKDCGKVQSYFQRPSEGDHWTYEVEKYDLADYGLCGGEAAKSACPCGEKEYIWWNSECEWNYYAYDDETNTEWSKCMDCGAHRSRTSNLVEDQGCYKIYENTEAFYNSDQEELFSLSAVEKHEEHTSEYTFTLEGNECSDGYYAEWTCKLCGKSGRDYGMPPEGEHPTYQMESYNMEEYGFCGGEVWHSICPCGEEEHIGYNVGEYCDFDFVYDPETGIETRTCSVCGSRMTEQNNEEIIDSCYSEVERIFNFYNAAGDLVVNMESTGIGSHHECDYTFNMYGETCHDGYEVYEACRNCEYRDSYYRDYHEDYCVERIDFGELGLCPGYVEQYRCACGESGHTNSSSGCNWNFESYDDAANTTTERCEECGATRIISRTETEKDEACVSYVTNTYQYMNADGEIVYTEVRNGSTENHREVCTYELLGETCEEGYYVNAVCLDCGRTEQYEGVRYGHERYCVERYDLEAFGMCGGEMRVYECACGKDASVDYNNFDCSYQYVSDHVSRCDGCGTTRERIDGEEIVDSCHSTYENTYIYSQNEEELFRVTEKGVNTYHDCVWTLSLMNPEGDCYDGVHATGTCRKCGEVQNDESYHHMNYLVERIDLSEFGLCNEVISRHACACGMEGYMTIDTYACDWQYQGSDEDGLRTYQCSNCHGTKTVFDEELREDGVCNYEVIRTITYYDESGSQVYQYEEASLYEGHEYKVVHVDMNDETDCEAGYTETRVCQVCGFTDTIGARYHDVQLVATYDLATYGACGRGSVDHYSCHCGKNEYVNYSTDCHLFGTHNSYVDDEGFEHSVDVSSCEECGFCYTVDRKRNNEEGTCLKTEDVVVTVTFGDELVAYIPYVSNYESHNLEITTSFTTESANCEDGVLITESCKDCDYTYSQEYRHHYIFTSEIIDLQELGAVCPGEVHINQCACGKEGSIDKDFAGCDFDEQFIDSWLGDEVAYQYTTDGSSGNGSVYGKLLTCAVTDPEQCGYKIRYCYYYVIDEANCLAERRQTWQFGYNEEDGTFDREVTIVTDTEQYHSYESTVTVDGNITTTEHVCSVCGSTWTEINEQDATGHTIRQEIHCVNTLDNGFAKQLDETSTWIVYNEDAFADTIHFNTVYADGSVYWINESYEYNWDAFDCTYVYNYENSNGHTSTNTGECHRTVHTHFEDATCSQPGSYGYVCNNCGCIESQYEIEPGHQWSWDSDLQTYVCYVCGIENANGANGSIIMEDLSTTDVYKVGYYNRDKVDYTYYVSLVLEDDSEIILEGVTFTEFTKENDGVTAIAFDKAEVADLAAAAVEEAGYAGTYEVRFAFVPYGSDGTLDYAITFTDDLEV